MKKLSIILIALLMFTGCRTLGMAVIDQNFQEAEQILSVGNKWEIDEPDHTGTTPLLYAASYGHPAMVKWLLDKGANINVQHKYTGETALLYGSYYGNIAVITILLDRGVDINQKNNTGYNALEYARKYHWTDIEKLLIEKGAIPIYK